MLDQDCHRPSYVDIRFGLSKITWCLSCPRWKVGTWSWRMSTAWLPSCTPPGKEVQSSHSTSSSRVSSFPFFISCNWLEVRFVPVPLESASALVFSLLYLLYPDPDPAYKNKVIPIRYPNLRWSKSKSNEIFKTFTQTYGTGTYPTFLL